MSTPIWLAYFRKDDDTIMPAKGEDPVLGAYIALGERGDPGKLKPLPRGKRYVRRMEASGLRKCHMCGDWRPLHMFGQVLAKVSRFNPKGYNSYCKSCRNKHRRERYRDQRVTSL